MFQRKNGTSNNRPLTDSREIIDQRDPTPLSNFTHFNSSAGAEAEHTSNRPSYPPSHPSHTRPQDQNPSANQTTADSVVHVRPNRTSSRILVPSLSLVPFRAAPAHPAHKTHRYSAEEPTQAAYTFPSTSQGPSRSLKSPLTSSSPQTKAVGQVRCPRLFVVRVNMQAHSHRRRCTQLHCLPARVSQANAGPLRDLVHVYHW